MVQAAQVVSHLTPIGVIPSSESQTRPFVPANLPEQNLWIFLTFKPVWAAQVVGNIESVTIVTPTSESQARPLTMS